MSALAVSGPGRAGYGPRLALSQLWRGALAPREAMRVALSTRIGEFARLAIWALFALALGLLDPETRMLGRSALANALDDASPTEGLFLLAFGAASIGLALVIGYWVAAFVTHAVCWPKWSRASLARARSVVVLSAWYSLLPTALVKTFAIAVLPAAMIAADPPSLFSAIEILVLIPFFAACLMAAFGVGLPRALATAIFVNGTFYLLVVILYLVAPSQ